MKIMRSLNLPASLICITSLIYFYWLTPPVVFSQAQNQVPVTINKKEKIYSIEQGSEKVFFFSLTKGKTYIVQVEQMGIDLGLDLMYTDSSRIYYHDSPNGKFGPEVFHFSPDSTAAYLLRVQPLQEEANAKKGKFSIGVQEATTQPDDPAPLTILSPAQMKKDLDVFRKIREKANSGFYRYRTKTEMDSLYHWAFDQVIRPMNIVDFYKIILVLTDAEGSCHNGTSLPYDIMSYIPKDKGFFPYYLKFIENTMVVNNAGREIPLGSRIISINGIKDTLLMKSFYKYFPVDGYNMTRKKQAAVDNSFGWRFPFEFGSLDSFIVEYSLPYSDHIHTITLKSISLDEKVKNYQSRHSLKTDSLIDPDVQDKYSFTLLNSSAALLNIRVFDMAANDEDPAYKVYCRFLDSIFTLIKEKAVPNLIIDIRGNPGGSGSNSERLFSYLADHAYRENTAAYVNYIKVPYPQYYVWNSSYPQNQKREQKDLEQELKETYPTEKDGKYYQDQALNPYWYPDTANRFTGKIYLLIDENVGSAASHFASYIKGHTNATIIGKECIGGYYGHNGHTPVEYRLPNSKIVTRFSIVHVTQDVPVMSTQPVGRGIIPGIEIARSFDDFMRNEDTEMKYVLDLIGKK